jgi:hypothetical protein
MITSLGHFALRLLQYFINAYLDGPHYPNACVITYQCELAYAEESVGLRYLISKSCFRIFRWFLFAIEWYGNLQRWFA